MIALADIPGRLAALLEPNRRGRSYAVTVLARIEDGHVEPLRAVLGGFAAESPLADLRYVHFGRWVVVDALKTEWDGVPEPKPRVGAPYLVFSADVTAPAHHYELPGDFFRDVAELMRSAADAVWGHCRGYPGADADADAVAAFLAARRVDAALYFAAFPDATVAEIRSALALRRHLAEFAQAQQHVGTSALLRRRYVEASRTWPHST